MNVYEKLQSARVQLQNKKLKKSGKNKFAGFEYFELADFLPTINAIFNEQKLFSLFKIKEQTAYLNIINSEKPDEIIEFCTPTAELELKGCNAIQALGGINTYCKRYLYLNALEIVESDMFDSTSGANKEEKKPIKKIKPVIKQEPDTSDFDIIAGLAGIADVVNLRKYYKDNKDAVTDLAAFETACKQRKAAIGENEAAQLY